MWMGNTLSPPLLTGSCIDCFERLSSLLRDPVYYGWGVRKGSGEPVLLIPGFFAGDWMMARDGAMARAHRLSSVSVRHRLERRLSGPHGRIIRMAYPKDCPRERDSAGHGGSQLGGNAGALNRGSISPAGTPPCDTRHTQSYGIVDSDSSRMAASGPRCPVTVERARRHPAAMRYAAVPVRFRPAVSTPARHRGSQFHLHSLRRDHRLAHLHRSAGSESRSSRRASELTHQSTCVSPTGGDSRRHSHNRRNRRGESPWRQSAGSRATPLLRTASKADRGPPRGKSRYDGFSNRDPSVRPGAKVRTARACQLEASSRC